MGVAEQSLSCYQSHVLHRFTSSSSPCLADEIGAEFVIRGSPIIHTDQANFRLWQNKFLRGHRLSRAFELKILRSMAPKSDSAEAIVLNYVNEQNRPLNSQNVADSLQKFNLKKASIQKTLDTLADSGKISFKEYGKQKIYLARQDQFNIPNNEELASMKEENAKLQEQLEQQKKAITGVEGEIKILQSNLTLEQIYDKEEKLRKEVKEMEDKLVKLRGGVTLVRPEEKRAVEAIYSEKMSQWRRRKRMFKDLWDAITENSPKDLKEFKEELGIEYDEDVGVNLQSFSELLQHGKKRARGQ
ncbi:Homologous-pairing protein 2 [Theobroma cacao]|nr:Homologous-pairing protein 2 [Theobroma cacao]